MRRATGLGLALALGVAPVVLPASAARAAAVAPAGRDLKIDVSELGAGYERLIPQIEEQARPVLEERGVDPAKVRLKVYWQDADSFSYAIRASVGKMDTPAADDPIVADCAACTEDAVADAAIRGLTKAIDTYEEEQKAAEPEPAPADAGAGTVTEPADVQPEPGPATPVGQDRPRARLGALGWSGIAGLVLGVGGVAAGGAFLGIRETRPKADKSQVRDFRPGGYALVGVGAALVITGAVLLGLDRARAKRRSSARLSPALGPRMTGFVVEGRF